MDVGRRGGRSCSEMSPGERALAESTERYRSMFTYHPHAAFSVDLEGRYTAANQAALDMTGLSMEELLSVDFAQVIHPEDLHTVHRAFMCALDREPQTIEARVLRPGGTMREVRVTAIPVVVADEVVGVHGISEDVTEQNSWRRELEASNAAKVLFLANVSHEIRTPLTSVVGATELLEDADLDPEPAHFVSVVARSCKRLVRLVDDILDFSRLEARAVALRAAPFHVRDLTEDLVEWAAPRARAKGLAFTCSVADEVPWCWQGDGGRISQVLSNLVDNAIKFTCAGSVDVRIAVVPSPSLFSEPDAGASCEWLQFDVVDTGTGIKADHLETLFDPFVQVDASATRAYDGVGLGLAICRDLSQLLGGQLTTESTPGAGSTFRFLVPPGGTERAPAAPTRAMASEGR